RDVQRRGCDARGSAVPARIRRDHARRTSRQRDRSLLQTRPSGRTKMTESATAYDEVDYPGHPFVETHPDHLAVLGFLYGMTPTPLRSCRVLELGCGVGANLIPMAFDAPDSKFVGIDLSAESVRRGNASIAKMGLSNIELRAYNIMDVTPDFGT